MDQARSNNNININDSDVNLESKSDDFEAPLSTAINNNHCSSSSCGKKLFDKVSKNQFRYTPKGVLGSSYGNNVSKPSDGGVVLPDEHVVLFEENWVSNDSQHASGDILPEK